MKQIIKPFGDHSIEVLGADNKYHSIPLEWDEHDNLSDKTRDQILATGMLLHLGLPLTGWRSCIDDFMELCSMALFSLRPD